MTFQIMATISFTFAVLAVTVGDHEIAAAGAFVGAGLFAIASAIVTAKK